MICSYSHIASICDISTALYCATLTRIRFCNYHQHSTFIPDKFLAFLLQLSLYTSSSPPCLQNHSHTKHLSGTHTRNLHLAQSFAGLLRIHSESTQRHQGHPTLPLSKQLPVKALLDMKGHSAVDPRLVLLLAASATIKQRGQEGS